MRMDLFESHYLADGGAIILAKPAVHFVNSRRNLAEAISVCLLGLSAHASNGKDLAVLQDALLQLAEQDAET